MAEISILNQLSEQLGRMLMRRNIVCAVAESCTGGGLAAAMTEIPGSSKWFDRGFVTYSNQAKQQILRVSHHDLSANGAVSKETAIAMAHGVMKNSNAHVSVAITGIAGPTGGSDEKPVGTVWIAWAGDLLPTQCKVFHFEGDRSAVRLQAIKEALLGLIRRCDPETHPQAQHEKSERYFFALCPQEKTAKSLYQAAQSIIKDGQILNEEKKLHLTLAYLGRVHPDFIEHAKQVADQIHTNSFKLNISKAGAWGRGKVVWLGTKNIPAQLNKLVTQLNDQLLTIGYVPDNRTFSPHITIARNYKDQLSSKIIKPVIWAVHDFCLLKSVDQAMGPAKYEVVQRWSF